MNILITSASAKIGLVTAFQDAGARVIAVDMNANCAARDYADSFYKIPEDNISDYITRILEICAKEDIKLIIPTRDRELMEFADLGPLLRSIGIALPLPEKSNLKKCLDKRAFHAFCQKHDYPVLPLIKPKIDAPWPLFVRHRTGSGGKNSCVIENWKQWLASGFDEKDVICQSVSTSKEYSIDVLMDLHGNPLQAVARERKSVIHGESSEGIIVDNCKLEKMCLNLCRDLGLLGHNVVQTFVDEKGDINFIEINPRFGGGSKMSIISGLASPKRLLQMVGGEADQANKPRKIKFGHYCNSDCTNFGKRVSQ